MNLRDLGEKRPLLIDKLSLEAIDSIVEYPSQLSLLHFHSQWMKEPVNRSISN